MILNKRRATQSSAFLAPTRRAMVILAADGVISRSCGMPQYTPSALSAAKITTGRSNNEWLKYPREKSRADKDFIEINDEIEHDFDAVFGKKKLNATVFIISFSFKQWYKLTDKNSQNLVLSQCIFIKYPFVID